MKLVPLVEAGDDPVLAAIATRYGVSIAVPSSQAMTEHENGRNDQYPAEMPTFSFGPAGGRYQGQAIVVIRGEPYLRYIRNLGHARLQIAGEDLPETVMRGLVGMQVADLVDVPGIGEWIISETKWDAVSERHEISICPGIAA